MLRFPRRQIFLILLLAGVVCLASCSSSSVSHRNRSLFIGIAGPGLVFDGDDGRCISEFRDYLLRPAREKFRDIDDYPAPMTRVTVRISFDSRRQMTMHSIQGAPSESIANMVSSAISEAYRNMPFTESGYANFSKATRIIFIFSSSN